MLLALAIVATVCYIVDMLMEKAERSVCAIAWHSALIATLWVLYVHCGVVNCE